MAVMGRPKEPLVLSKRQREELESVARSRSLPHGLVRRAKIILLSVDGLTNKAIGERIGMSNWMVGEWRKRYLRHYLSGYPAPDLDMDQLVTESDGATPAFLKEWVHRSVQISLEHSGDGNRELELRNEDFSRAMDEMKMFSEGSKGRIIGFQASR